MFNLYPRLALRENRMILSRTELEVRLEEAVRNNKSCEVGLYAFEEWRNSKPVVESVVVDSVLLKGDREELEKVGEYYSKKGIRSYLLHDGEKYILILRIYLKSLEVLREFTVPFKVEVERDPLVKIVVPGAVNLRTGRKCRVVRKW